jgi:hypothetical protein
MSSRFMKRNLSPQEKRFSYFGLFTASVLLSLFLPQFALARTWYIKADGTGDAPTIQAGVDSAVAGDTVLVGPGVYSDTHQVLLDGVPRIVNVEMSKNIVMVAEESGVSTTIRGPSSDIAIYICNVDSNAAIVGFGIETHTSGYGCVLSEADARRQGETFGVAIWCDSSAVTISGIEIFGNNAGVYLRRSHARIRENTIYRGLVAISCNDQSDALIERNDLCDCAVLVQSDNSAPLVRQNHMWSNLDIVCDGVAGTSSSPVISQNQFKGMTNWAINCGGGSPAIDQNKIEDCNQGALQLRGTTATHVSGNLILLQNSAIYVTGGANVLIENNTIQYAVTGVFLDQTAAPAVVRNIVELCTIGIDCYFPSGPIIACNDVFNCQEPYAGQCPDLTDVDGNFSEDPQYCGVEGSNNYYLQSDSPCAPGNHPYGYACDLIGCWPVNCGDVPTERRTWGDIKSKYGR